MFKVFKTVKDAYGQVPDIIGDLVTGQIESLQQRVSGEHVIPKPIKLIVP